MAMLTSYVDRCERLLAEIAGVNESLKEVLIEAKEAGFDSALVRKVATIKVRDSAKKEARKLALLHTYAAECGVQLELPIDAPERVAA